jgi:hypothetical protein
MSGSAGNGILVTSIKVSVRESSSILAAQNRSLTTSIGWIALLPNSLPIPGVTRSWEMEEIISYQFK